MKKLIEVAKKKPSSEARAKKFAKKVTPEEVLTTQVGIVRSLSKSRAGIEYAIHVHEVWGVRTWTCTCPAFVFGSRGGTRVPCKHLRGLWEGTLPKEARKLTPQGGKILTAELKSANRRVGRPSVSRIQLELALPQNEKVA